MAGSGEFGFSGDGGPATSAAFNVAGAIAVDRAGNLWISDTGNHRIRKVAAGTGIISTVAGNGSKGFSGDNGPATNAALNVPVGISVDAAGNLFIADGENWRIRRVEVSTGTITTVAGSGEFGFSGDGGPALLADLTSLGLTTDAAGNVFVTDPTSSLSD